MAWVQDGKPKVFAVTKPLVAEFAQMEPAPNDRPLKNWRCSMLRSIFQHKRFRTAEWSEAFCEETQKHYRINGKHTSTVLFSMFDDFPEGLYVTRSSYVCHTLQDVAELYSTFDRATSNRSSGDINWAYAACVKELEGITNKVVSLAVTGMAFEMWEYDYGDQSQERRAELLLEYPEFVVWLNGILDPKDKAAETRTLHMRRGTVISAMFRTWKKSRQASTEFWTMVRDGSAVDPNCPSRKFERYLLTLRATKPGVIRKNETEKTNRREVYVKGIHAWNAWRKEVSTILRYIPAADTPKVV